MEQSNPPTYIFIVPYRDRIPHKTFFNTYMKSILEDYDNKSYKILFVHQNDKRPFNRGGMKNIGFLYIKNLYPDDYKSMIFIFNDVDTVPYKKGLLNYHINFGEIKHFYGYNFALGGIFSIRGKDFESLNGFPNYWYWGFEDNIIYKRAIKNKMIINRNTFYKITDSEILHFFDNINKKIDQQNLKNQFNKKHVEKDGISYLKNINYSFNVETNMLDVNSFNSLYSANNTRTINHNIIENGSKINNPFIRKATMKMSFV